MQLRPAKFPAMSGKSFQQDQSTKKPRWPHLVEQDWQTWLQCKSDQRRTIWVTDGAGFGRVGEAPPPRSLAPRRSNGADYQVYSAPNENPCKTNEFSVLPVIAGTAVMLGSTIDRTAPRSKLASATSSSAIR